MIIKTFRNIKNISKKPTSKHLTAWDLAVVVEILENITEDEAIDEGRHKCRLCH